jgi:hypothetical protein
MERRRFLAGLVGAAGLSLVPLKGAQAMPDGSITTNPLPPKKLQELTEGAMPEDLAEEVLPRKYWPCTITFPNGDERPFLVDDTNMRKLLGQRSFNHADPNKAVKILWKDEANDVRL